MKAALGSGLLALVIAGGVVWPRAVMSHGSSTTTVLFDREIVRILNERCVMCHADNSLSFPLVTYEQTWLQGRSMRSSVLRRHMPPWPAVAGYGDFVNDNHLTMRETQFLVSWVEGLGPRNAGKVFLNVVDPKAGASRGPRHDALGSLASGRAGPGAATAATHYRCERTGRGEEDRHRPGVVFDAPDARIGVHAWRSPRRTGSHLQHRADGTMARRLDAMARFHDPAR